MICPNCCRILHHRCRGRDGCSCTVCAASIRTRRKVVEEKENADIYPDPLPPVRSAEKFTKGGWPRRPGISPRGFVPPEVVQEGVRLRQEGLTYREIGKILGFDYSGLSRKIKKATAEQCGHLETT